MWSIACLGARPRDGDAIGDSASVLSPGVRVARATDRILARSIGRNTPILLGLHQLLTRGQSVGWPPSRTTEGSRCSLLGLRHVQRKKMGGPVALSPTVLGFEPKTLRASCLLGRLGIRDLGGASAVTVEPRVSKRPHPTRERALSPSVTEHLTSQRAVLFPIAWLR